MHRSKLVLRSRFSRRMGMWVDLGVQSAWTVEVFNPKLLLKRVPTTTAPCMHTLAFTQLEARLETYPGHVSVHACVYACVQHPLSTGTATIIELLASVLYSSSSTTFLSRQAVSGYVRRTGSGIVRRFEVVLRYRSHYGLLYSQHSRNQSSWLRVFITCITCYCPCCCWFCC
jgi:hypothetical protein